MSFLGKEKKGSFIVKKGSFIIKREQCCLHFPSRNVFLVHQRIDIEILYVGSTKMGFALMCVRV